MLKREKLFLLFTGILLFTLTFSLIDDKETEYMSYDNNNNLMISSSLEGIENVVITKTIREANISSYGLLVFEDYLTIKNLNNNPISSIFFGIPTYEAEDLIFFEASGINKNTLFAERSSTIMNGYEMIVIYFNSPLLPHQTTTIRVKYIYKDVISYFFIDIQHVDLLVSVYPILPYRMEGEIKTTFGYPSSGKDVQPDWGTDSPGIDRIFFFFDDIKDEIGDDFITPFMENLGNKMVVRISFTDDTQTKTEMKKINRDIFISPWGILRIKEEFTIENLGEIDFYSFSLSIPQDATNLYVSDDLGEILGVTIENSIVTINLLDNRVKMTPGSIFNFKVEYNLPFENYVSLNWFQESVKIDLLTTLFNYLGRDQTINVIIDGCYNIESITEFPDAIKKVRGATVLVYKSDFVSPFENKIIQFTFTIDLFNMLLRPIMITLLIAIITSVFVLIIKTRKKERDKAIIIREIIPISEIREFCSLYEEKNALTLEIRQAEEDTKRKKIAKKTYKNILNKNTSKIDELQKEIIPFKKIIISTNEVFENIIKKLDILEAERISVKDSLNLLESRYKRGRLPSRAAYLKLSDDFKKRTRKIDRTIDKLIQQLSSYLL
ncbi:MAG: hypothetical protein ACFE9Q_03200 [Candidatus Hodarchaeota archaeon]